MPWTRDEVEKLKTFYTNRNLSHEEISRYFVNKTPRACQAKAVRLRLLNENYHIWTTEEEQKLKKLLDGTISYKSIGKILNINSESCRYKAITLGLNNKYILRKYTVNKEFWDNTNLTSCYWAGFTAADGNLYINKCGNLTFRIELAEKDEKHLYKFKNDCQYTGEIKRYKRINRANGTCKIGINCQEWLNPLEKNFGIIPNKTKRMIPTKFLSDELNYAWLMGMVDGDGTIYNSIKHNYLIIKIVGANYQMLNHARDIMLSVLKKYNLSCVIPEVRLLPKVNCYIIELTGKKAAILINHLKKINVPCLKRKWNQENVENYINNLKQKSPELFIENRSSQSII